MEMNYDKIIEQFYEEQQRNGGKQRLAPPGSRLTLSTMDAGSYDSGAIFEARTVKGGKNYIIFMMVYHNFAYYMHGDRCKKVDEQRFKDLISAGDLLPIPREKADIEKLALCVLSLNAMTHGLSFNDYMKVYHGYGDGSEVRT